MTQPAISKHLKVLERAGLVTRRRDAQRRPCRLEAVALREATEWLETYRRFWAEQYERLDDLLAELQIDRPSGRTRPMTTTSRPRPHRRADRRPLGAHRPVVPGAAPARVRRPHQARARAPLDGPGRVAVHVVRDRPAARRRLPLRDVRAGGRGDGDARPLRRGRPAVTPRVDDRVRRRLDRRRDRQHDDVRRGRRRDHGDADRRLRLGRVTRAGAGHPDGRGDGGRLLAPRRAGPAARRRDRPLPAAAPTASSSSCAPSTPATGTARRRAPSGARATSSATSSTCTT